MLVWLSKRISLAAFLEMWRSSGTNFVSDQPIDSTWNVDGQSVVLGPGDDDELFERAIERLFSYQIYPRRVMECTADFVLQDRPPNYGDRIIQRIRILPGVLDAITMNIVTSVWHESDRRGFTAITSDQHYEMGEWTASVSRKRGGDLTFMMQAVSRPSARLPVFAGGWARRLQKRGHRLALQHFRESLPGPQQGGG